MIFCKNTIFAFLLIGALFCYSHAELYPDEVVLDTNYNESSSSSKTGIVIGSVLTGLGVVFFISAAVYTPEKEENTSLKDCLNNNSCSLVGDLTVPVLGGASLLFLLIGVPILIYNIGKNSITPNHPLMNEDFVYSSKRYRPQKSSIQIKFTPTVNFMKSSAGFNATLRF